jgi:hypothetical protein
VAAAAFGEQRVFRQQFHAGLVGGRGLAVVADAHVAGGDAAHGTLVVIQHLGAGKAGIDLDAERFGLRAEPAAELAEADHIVAVVLEAARQQQGGQVHEAMFGEEGEAVAGDGGLQRGALRLPVGEQLGQRARVHHGAGQDMGADFRTLLDQADVDFRIDLLETDGGGKSRRAAAHDDDVEFHGFALHADLDRLV